VWTHVESEVEWFEQEVPFAFYRNASAIIGGVIILGAISLGTTALRLLGRLGFGFEFWVLLMLAVVAGVAGAAASAHSSRGQEARAIGVSSRGVTLRFRRGGEESIPWDSVVNVESPSRSYFFGAMVAYQLDYRDARGRPRALVLMREPTAAIARRLARLPPDDKRPSRGDQAEPGGPGPNPPKWMAGGLEAVYVDSLGGRDWIRIVPGGPEFRVEVKVEFNSVLKGLLKEGFGEIRADAEIEAGQEWEERRYSEYVATSYGVHFIDVSREHGSHRVARRAAEYVGEGEAEFDGARYACLKLRSRDVFDCSCKKAGRPGVCTSCGGKRGLFRTCETCGGSGKCTDCPGTGESHGETLRLYEATTGLFLRSDRWVDGQHTDTTRLERLSPNVLALFAVTGTRAPTQSEGAEAPGEPGSGPSESSR